jgi:hypothetical protein
VDGRGSGRWTRVELGRWSEEVVEAGGWGGWSFPVEAVGGGWWVTCKGYRPCFKG